MDGPALIYVAFMATAILAAAVRFISRVTGLGRQRIELQLYRERADLEAARAERSNQRLERALLEILHDINRPLKL